MGVLIIRALLLGPRALICGNSRLSLHLVEPWHLKMSALLEGASFLFAGSCNGRQPDIPLQLCLKPLILEACQDGLADLVSPYLEGPK